MSPQFEKLIDGSGSPTTQIKLSDCDYRGIEILVHSKENNVNGSRNYATLALLVSMLALMGVGRPVGLISLSCMLSIAAHALTDRAIPHFARLLMAAGQSGLDQSKMGSPRIPESLGIAAGAIYLLIMFTYLPIPFLSPPSSPFLFSNQKLYTSKPHSVRRPTLNSFTQISDIPPIRPNHFVCYEIRL
jgi:hypothetical protein